ncbi:two-component system response regulator [Brasilonema octagenarum UFV-E1]|uniref:Two-component system response regulator n=2 Tax=Brasilonema TaxID=383614 RepID=A0A856MK18_9CYAN|nr:MULTISPECIES: response regulator [Brasilonema]NMF65977.1 two-component system response regulator [Brasilonema octagenarum UFV-OR1]QDL10494.1 two-component system response regulator [Brasilonema sennae CENA114]QDL16840.1 two-component system response regulator [Brasilonema octagenarum UFV-E1]
MLPKRILVIDDEENLCTIIKISLEYLGGWQVLVATSSSEGLLLVQTELFDLILLDVVMPDMNGLVLLSALRINPVTRTIPVILLTASTQPVNSNESAQLGVAGIIIKPFDPVDLPNQIKVLLRWE